MSRQKTHEKKFVPAFWIEIIRIFDGGRPCRTNWMGANFFLRKYLVLSHFLILKTLTEDSTLRHKLRNQFSEITFYKGGICISSEIIIFGLSKDPTFRNLSTLENPKQFLILLTHLLSVFFLAKIPLFWNKLNFTTVLGKLINKKIQITCYQLIIGFGAISLSSVEELICDQLIDQSKIVHSCYPGNRIERMWRFYESIGFK